MQCTRWCHKFLNYICNLDFFLGRLVGWMDGKIDLRLERNFKGATMEKLGRFEVERWGGRERWRRADSGSGWEIGRMSGEEDGGGAYVD